MKIIGKNRPQCFEIIQGRLRRICHEEWKKVIRHYLHHPLSPMNDNDEWLSVICVFVWKGKLRVVWEINSAYVLTFPIWKSLAAGSKRDIQMVSLLAFLQLGWLKGTNNNTLLDASKKQKQATCMDGNHRGRFCNKTCQYIAPGNCSPQRSN